MSQKTIEIAIIRFVHGWRIVANDRRWGRYHYRVDAEEGALRLAARARSEGRQLSILVQESSGELRPLDAA